MKKSVDLRKNAAFEIFKYLIDRYIKNIAADHSTVLDVDFMELEDALNVQVRTQDQTIIFNGNIKYPANRYIFSMDSSIGYTDVEIMLTKIENHFNEDKILFWFNRIHEYRFNAPYGEWMWMADIFNSQSEDIKILGFGSTKPDGTPTVIVEYKDGKIDSYTYIHFIDDVLRPYPYLKNLFSYN